MANPLFNQFGNNQNNSMSQFMSDFNRLKQTISNPKQMVESLLQSGQMSQDQFNQFSQMANQIMWRK
jgi:hypothetical protein